MNSGIAHNELKLEAKFLCFLDILYIRCYNNNINNKNNKNNKDNKNSKNTKKNKKNINNDN